jgi:hypothetical protein
MANKTCKTKKTSKTRKPSKIGKIFLVELEQSSLCSDIIANAEKERCDGRKG